MSQLFILDPRAAGIDVGSESMHVSIGGESPKIFGSTTIELQHLRDWLLTNEVKTVAVEATGVYWLCLYEVLETAGIQVVVVNGRHVKNLPGRKTDISDCQWLATLHSHGLLRGGFVPSAQVRCLQDYVRLRQEHVAQASSHVLHMQKALERMNLKPHDVIRSLTGVSGLRIMRAIVAGERDPDRLLDLCDVQIRKKKAARLREALRGNWKSEHLFALRQALQAWDFCQQQIGECDAAIEDQLKAMQDPKAPPPSDGGQGGGAPDRKKMDFGAISSPESEPLSRYLVTKKRHRGPNAPKVAQLHELLIRLCGDKDPTLICGIADHTLLQLIAELGTDLKAWTTAKHFVSWLGLAPGNNQSGKRRGAVKRQTNRAGRLFCTIAMAVGRSKDTALGGFYRRLKARRGAPIANKALARKIAVLFWQLMVQGLAYVEEGLAAYQVKAAASQLQLLEKMAAKQGMILTPKSVVIV